ncbi:MAG: DUF4347 domain-containing protein, partial [Propionivibrio sp.]
MLFSTSPRVRQVPCDRRAIVETMEERILHSADLAPLLIEAGVSDISDSQAETLAENNLRANEIAFIDAALPDAAELRADLLAQSAAGRSIEVVVIEAGADGFSLITRTLAERHDLAAVHVLAHGSDGQLQLGNSLLDAQSLLQRAGEVAGWGQALSQEGDLLLYGCDLAATTAGQQLVQNLAALTGADVAASTDTTGAAARGGDWVLEYQTGRIEAALAPSLSEQMRWLGVMDTFQVTTTNDQVGTLLTGSLRWAISQANARPGLDTIVFQNNGTYTMLAGSSGDDTNASGDFDITDSVNIVGNGASNTVINGNRVDRVFDVRSGTVSFSGLTIQNGASQEGAGLRVLPSVSVTLTDAIVQGNIGIGSSKGAGIYSDGSLSLIRTLIQNNGDAPNATDGAGVYINTGNLYAFDVEFSDNNAAGKEGGGLTVKDDKSSTAILERVTFFSNTAKDGGGLWNHGKNTTLTNVTFSSNQASNEGGGIWTDKRLVIDHGTFANNSSALLKGGAIYDKHGDSTIANSLLIDNGIGLNTNTALVSLGYNISADFSAGFSATGDRKGLIFDVGLQSLAANGGFTRTHAIGVGSSAIDAAKPVDAVVTDQRGTSRYGGRSDIGAYEYSPLNAAPTGTVTISGTPTQGQTLTAANTLADADGLGPISYQWRANGSNIAGAIGNTLVLAEAQVGQAMTVVASYTDGHGKNETKISAATVVVANINDAPTGT